MATQQELNYLRQQLANRKANSQNGWNMSQGSGSMGELKPEQIQQAQSNPYVKENGWTRFWDTVNAPMYNLWRGVADGVDTVMDWVANTTAALGWQSRESADNFINADWQSFVYNISPQNMLSNVYKGIGQGEAYWSNFFNVETHNYNKGSLANAILGEKGADTLHKAENTAGSIIETIAVPTKIGAVAKSAKAAKIAGLALAGAKGYMGGTNRAIAEGADYGKASAYGALEAGVNVGTQLAFPMLSKATGIGAKDLTIGGWNLTNKLVQGSASKTIVDAMFKEGAKAGVRELLEPLIQMTYKGGASLEQYGSSDYWGNVGKSAATGAVIGGIMSGIQVAEIRKAVGKDGMSAGKTLGKVQSEMNKAKADFDKGKISQEQLNSMEDKWEADIQDAFAKINNMSPEQRQNFIKMFYNPEQFAREVKEKQKSEVKPSEDGQHSLITNKDGRQYQVTETDEVTTFDPPTQDFNRAIATFTKEDVPADNMALPISATNEVAEATGDKLPLTISKAVINNTLDNGISEGELSKGIVDKIGKGEYSIVKDDDGSSSFIVHNDDGKAYQVVISKQDRQNTITAIRANPSIEADEATKHWQDSQWMLRRAATNKEIDIRDADKVVKAEAALFNISDDGFAKLGIDKGELAARYTNAAAFNDNGKALEYMNELIAKAIDKGTIVTREMKLDDNGAPVLSKSGKPIYAKREAPIAEVFDPKELAEIKSQISEINEDLIIGAKESVTSKKFNALKERIDKANKYAQEERAKKALVNPTRNALKRAKGDYEPVGDKTHFENPETAHEEYRVTPLNHIKFSDGNFYIDDEFESAVDKMAEYAKSTAQSYSTAKDEGGSFAVDQKTVNDNIIIAEMYEDFRQNYLTAKFIRDASGIAGIKHPKVLDSKATARLQEIAKAIASLRKKEESHSLETRSAATQTYLALQDKDRMKAVNRLVQNGMVAYDSKFLGADVALESALGRNDPIVKEFHAMSKGKDKALLNYRVNVTEKIEKKSEELGYKPHPKNEMVEVNGSKIPYRVAKNVYMGMLATETEIDPKTNLPKVAKNIKSIQKGVNWTDKHGVEHRTEGLDDIKALEKVLDEPTKKMAKWFVDYLDNEQNRSEFEKYQESQGVPVNTIQGKHVPLAMVSGQSRLGGAKVIGSNRFTYGITRNSAVNFYDGDADVEDMIAEEYLMIQDRTYVTPHVETINDILNGFVETNGKMVRLNKLFSESPSLCKGITRSMDRVIRQYEGTYNQDDVGRMGKGINYLMGNFYTLSLASLQVMAKQPISVMVADGVNPFVVTMGSPAVLGNLNTQSSKYAWRRLTSQYEAYRGRGKDRDFAKAMTTSQEFSAFKKKFTILNTMSDLGAIHYLVSAIDLQAKARGYRFGTEEYDNYIDDIGWRMIKSQINSDPLFMSEVRASKNPIERWVFGAFQGAPQLAAKRVFQPMQRVMAANALPSLAEIENQQSSAREKAKEAEKNYDEANARVEELAEEEVNREDYDTPEEYKEAKDDLKDRREKAKQNASKAREEFIKAKAKKAKADADYETKSKAKTNYKEFAYGAFGIAAAAVAMTLVNDAFKYWYGKKDRSTFLTKGHADDVMKNFTYNSLVNWIPGVNAVGDVLIQGHDASVPMLGNVNDAAKDLRKIFTAFQEGKFDNSLVGTSIDLISNTTGIPFDNIYKPIYGTIKLFSPETALAMGDVFYGFSSSANANLTAAIANGDEQAAKGYIKSIGRNASGELSGDETNELYGLAKSGYKVLPPSVPTSYYDDDGNTVKISWSDQQAIKRYYSRANKEAEKAIKSYAYKKLDGASRASVLKAIYQAYRYAATSKVLGSKYKPYSKLSLLASTQSHNVSMLAILAKSLKAIEATKTKTRKELALAMVKRSGLSNGDRLIVLAMAGYKVDENSLKRALKAKGLSNSDIKKFMGEDKDEDADKK